MSFTIKHIITTLIFIPLLVLSSVSLESLENVVALSIGYVFFVAYVLFGWLFIFNVVDRHYGG